MVWIKYRAKKTGDRPKAKRKEEGPPRYEKDDELVLIEYGSVVALAPQGVSKNGRMVKVYNSQFIDDFVPVGILESIDDLEKWLIGK